MIPGYEFFNHSKRIGNQVIYRVSVRQYLVLMDILGRIGRAIDKKVISALKLEVIKMASSVRRPWKRDMWLFDEITRFNIPPTKKNNTAGKSSNSKPADIYKNVLILIDVIVNAYPSVSIPDILDHWNIIQVTVMHGIVKRREAMNYQEFTSIYGLAKIKPQTLMDRYMGIINPERPVSTQISVGEAFRLSAKANRKGAVHAEFH